MKVFGKLIRAKKAEKVYQKIADQGFWKDIKIESVFGGEAIITQIYHTITEKESDADNDRIQALLAKNKKVFYLNCYVEPNVGSLGYNNPFIIPAGTTLTLPPGNFNVGSTVSLGSTIILKVSAVGMTTITNTLTSWASKIKKGPRPPSGFRIFVAAKDEKEIIHKLSRALKYDFML